MTGTGAWILAIAPIAAQTANCAVQLGSLRLLRVGLLKSIFIGFGVGLIVVVALTAMGCSMEAASAADWAGQMIANLCIACALGYGYFHFINLGETARRVRILREFVEAGGHLSEQALLHRYNADEIVRVRLGRLLRSRQVILAEGRYRIGNRTVLRMSGVLRGLKLLLLGKQSEFH